MELNHPDDPRNTRAYLEAAYGYLIEDNLRLSEALSDSHAEVRHLRAILNTLQRVQRANGGDKDALPEGTIQSSQNTSRGTKGPEPRQRASISGTSRPNSSP